MKGILFRPEMVKAILDGTKTQSRRVIKPQFKIILETFLHNGNTYIQTELLERDKNLLNGCIKARYQVGEIVYIKEKALYWVSPILDGVQYNKPSDWWSNCVYQDDPEIPHLLADNKRLHLERIVNDAVEGNPIIGKWEWKSPLHMPKEAARYFIKIIDAREERLQKITPEDCVAEGYPFGAIPLCRSDRELSISKQMRLGWYKDLWNSINAKWKRVWNRELKIYEYWQFPWCEADAVPIPKNTQHPERYHCIPNPWVFAYSFKLEMPGD